MVQRARGGKSSALVGFLTAGEAGRGSRALSMALLLQHQFKCLPADKQVDTVSFLESVSHLPSFFDCLGPAIFSPIKSDITGNITKIRAVYESNPTKFKTLQQILEGEKEMYGPQWPKVGATLALMWLKRALKFIQVLLQSMADGERDEQNPNLMKVNVTKAYEIALKKYHGWLVQKLFQAALIAGTNPRGHLLVQFKYDYAKKSGQTACWVCSRLHPETIHIPFASVPMNLSMFVSGNITIHAVDAQREKTESVSPGYPIIGPVYPPEWCFQLGPDKETNNEGGL
uniref:Glycolipid transfer protein n=1 Tax=Leptobrachium leishanense TaxID=445787 RepID=A0A8C5LMY0_9ANUR